jgi:amidophosphoribosyltransferase
MSGCLCGGHHGHRRHVGFAIPGIRPLAQSTRRTGSRVRLAVRGAALDILGYQVIRDVAPGEAIINRSGERRPASCAAPATHTPCIFEQVYSRPDSIIDEVSVYAACGWVKLADRILANYSGRDHDIDVVIPIPIGSTAALPMAHAGRQIPKS